MTDYFRFPRIEEVEQDIVLPPLKESTVLLDLHPYSLIHFNLLQAVVAVNAVDSERTDIVSIHILQLPY